MVSLCSTVFNEADSIAAWVDGLLSQTRPPDEIVICDAGSTDGTIDVLTELAGKDNRVKIIVELGANISQGRNVAISHASNELIAITDAGTVADADWLEQIIKPLEKDPELAVSAGFYRPAGRNYFERVLATVITPRYDDLYPDGYPPSSRSVAFRKKWWDAVGGYPEWLRVCEDLVFDMKLFDAGARFEFCPEAKVAWYPHPEIKAYFRQYYGYARGDGHAHLYPDRHFLRYAAYLIGLFLARRSATSWPARVLLTVGIIFHLKKFVARVVEEQPSKGLLGRLGAFLLVPVIVVTGDIAKMIGYPRGLRERQVAGSEDGLLDVAIEPHRRSANRAKRIEVE